MMQKRAITRDDIMPIELYAKDRKAHRQSVIALKKHRRVEVGPVATFYFENYDTMWAQVHEMLFIEKGGEDQIPDELAAYNPLIPQGRELVATIMFEIDDPVRRGAFLAKLGGIEDSVFVQVGDETAMGVPEADVDRTSAAGKASSVQFVHVPLSDAQAQAFKTPGAQVTIGFSHPEYSHMAVLPEPVRAALAEDLD